ncbi:HlyD family secretion protein [Novipirellula sp.]|uniref:HlyD family secretion protein n=1 Tax=Novipirellula sp. TaxID=2795430 RepID=UPI0035697E59
MQPPGNQDDSRDSVAQLESVDGRTTRRTAADTGSNHASQSTWRGIRQASECRPRRSPSPPRPPAPITPVPIRPKRSLFTGSLLICLCTAIGYYVWDWQLRYQSHGVVQGRVLQVTPPWDGNVLTLQVREGDSVRQGQVLLTVTNIEQEQRTAEVADALKLAQATLEAKVSEMRWQSQLRGDRNQKALGEYYEMCGELSSQRTQLMQAESELQRLRATREKNEMAVRNKDLENASYLVEGLRAKCEKQTEAVAEMKKRVEIYEQFADDASATIQPAMLQISNLQAELVRLREVVQQGRIGSPVNGTVLKVRRFAGDYANASETVMEILEDSTIEPVLYYSQNNADKLRVGDEVKIDIRPGVKRLRCRITRIGEQLEYAPPNIERYYRKNEKLLPVYLQPCDVKNIESLLYLGSEIDVPRFSLATANE